jgi:hypothetical protein
MMNLRLKQATLFQIFSQISILCILFRSYFKGISANIELHVYGVWCEVLLIVPAEDIKI